MSPVELSNRRAPASWAGAGCALLLLLPAGAARAQAPDATPGQRVLVYDWARGSLVDAQGDPTGPPEDIDRHTSVTVRVRSFNYFRYAPRLQLQQETLEAYAFLDGLWRGVLGFDPAVLAELMAGRRGFTLEATDDFEGRYDELRYTMFRLRWLMRERMTETTAVALAWDPALARFPVYPDEFPGADCARGVREDDSGACSIGLDALVEHLQQVRADLDRFVIDNRDDSDAVSRTNLNRYFGVVEEHAETMAAVASFRTALEFIEHGRPFVVGTRPAGTRVTATLVPRNADGTDVGTPASVTWFVESELPATFSVGYLLSGLRDVSVEKLRLDGTDVFQLQADDATSHDLAAFLSLRPGFGDLSGDGSVALLATLGTSLSDPGAKLLLGPSLQVDRWLLTVGVATGRERRPLDPVDPADAGSVAGLFRSLSETREWTWFASLSFSPLR